MTVVLETVLGFVARPCFYAATRGILFFPPAIVANSHPFRQKRAIPATTRLEIY